MKTLSERLQHALSVRGKSAAELARAVKKTESAVSQWVNGETKAMRGDSLMATCNFLACQPSWLASGVGASGLEEPPSAQSVSAPSSDKPDAATSVAGITPDVDRRAVNHLSLDRLLDLLPDDPILRATVFHAASSVILDVVNGRPSSVAPTRTETQEKSRA